MLPASSAAIAACFMKSGVSKSGSPAPNPTMFFPSALNCFALAVIAGVEEGVIFFESSDNILLTPLQF